jgi:hypothetical protein
MTLRIFFQIPDLSDYDETRIHYTTESGKAVARLIEEIPPDSPVWDYQVTDAAPIKWKSTTEYEIFTIH